MIMDNRKTIEAIDAAIKRLQERRAELIPCEYAEPTGKYCEICSGKIEWIYCKKKKFRVRKTVCNSNCKSYQSGE
jgi:hypothetical protein